MPAEAVAVVRASLALLHPKAVPLTRVAVTGSQGRDRLAHFNLHECRPCAPVRAVHCAAQAKQAPVVSRRTAALVATLAAVASAGPAQAFLGFGEDPGKEYTERTVCFVGLMG